MREFDQAIAHIDRALSEVMIQTKKPQDEADTATLRHHAGDLILSGTAILKRLGRLGDLNEYLRDVPFHDEPVSKPTPPVSK